jgi:hypothetical protein
MLVVAMAAVAASLSHGTSSAEPDSEGPTQSDISLIAGHIQGYEARLGLLPTHGATVEEDAERVYLNRALDLMHEYLADQCAMMEVEPPECQSNSG